MSYTACDAVNVLIGYSPEKVRMLESTGSELHIFDKRLCLLARFLSNAVFHKVTFTYSHILSKYLLSLAETKKDKLLFLYASDEYRELLFELECLVEHKFILKHS